MVVGDSSPSFDHPREEGEIWGELSGADGGRMLEEKKSANALSRADRRAIEWY